MLKLYLDEEGSKAMLRFADTEDARDMGISALAHIEARSAITRLRRTYLTDQDAALVMNAITASTQLMFVQEVDSLVLDTAGIMIDLHGLRALDAIQLSSAIRYRDLKSAAETLLIASGQSASRSCEQRGLFRLDPAKN